MSTTIPLPDLPYWTCMVCGTVSSHIYGRVNVTNVLWRRIEQRKFFFSCASQPTLMHSTDYCTISLLCAALKVLSYFRYSLDVSMLQHTWKHLCNKQHDTLHTYDTTFLLLLCLYKKNLMGIYDPFESIRFQFCIFCKAYKYVILDIGAKNFKWMMGQLLVACWFPQRDTM